MRYKSAAVVRLSELVRQATALFRPQSCDSVRSELQPTVPQANGDLTLVNH
jgi:hypothetical protein